MIPTIVRKLHELEGFTYDGFEPGQMTDCGDSRFFSRSTLSWHYPFVCNHCRKRVFFTEGVDHVCPYCGNGEATHV